MTHAFFVSAALAAALLLGGCAATAPDKTTSAAPEAAVPQTAPVKIPAESARKVVLVMHGPKQVVDARDWTTFKQEWRDTFAEHAKTAGIAFAVAEPGAAPRGEAGTLIDVNVADYRMVGIGARVFFGVMTGNAYMDARIRFADLRDGKTFGEQSHNTTSSAWSGVFAKVTPQQVDAIATDVFRDLKAAR